MHKNISLILDNIRSVHNVGSIFRTADAAGVSHVYLIGITPTPLDRFGRVRKDIAKVALGAETTVPWSHLETIEPLIEKLKSEGVHIIALEQSENAIDYKLYGAKSPVALIVGNEVGGISQDVLNRVDGIIEIPMRGEKESLNVAVATGIALFSLLD
jgi:23S rRNA (guanosine2251-2'-O)-methyltransferase